MKILNTIGAILIALLMIIVILLGTILLKGTFSSVSSDFLALIGAFILLRVALLLIVVGSFGSLLYYAVSGVGIVTKVYQQASPRDQERLKQSFHDGLRIFRNIMDMAKEFRK